MENTRLDNLLVIADFDATITTGDSIQCHDMLGFSELMTPAFRREFAPLLDWATNPDVDGVAWWDKAHELMIKHGQPPRHLIPRMVRETRMEPRPGALKLLARLAVLQVPLLIVSAGLSDVIEEFLRQHDALTENITVCSNRLNYGASTRTARMLLPASPPTTCDPLPRRRSRLGAAVGRSEPPDHVLHQGHGLPRLLRLLPAALAALDTHRARSAHLAAMADSL